MKSARDQPIVLVSNSQENGTVAAQVFISPNESLTTLQFQQDVVSQENPLSVNVEPTSDMDVSQMKKKSNSSVNLVQKSENLANEMLIIDSRGQFIESPNEINLSAKQSAQTLISFRQNQEFKNKSLIFTDQENFKKLQKLKEQEQNEKKNEYEKELDFYDPIYDYRLRKFQQKIDYNKLMAQLRIQESEEKQAQKGQEIKNLISNHFQKKIILTPPVVQIPEVPKEPEKSERTPKVYEREAKAFTNEFVDELHENNQIMEVQSQIDSENPQYKHQIMFFEQNDHLFLLLGREKIETDSPSREEEEEEISGIFYVVITVDSQFLSYFDIDPDAEMDLKIEQILAHKVFQEILKEETAKNKNTQNMVIKEQNELTSQGSVMEIFSEAVQQIIDPMTVSPSPQSENQNGE